MDIKLPEPKLEDLSGIGTCMEERVSRRKFKSKELTLEEISLLAWAAQGEKGRNRTAPSAGATYPLEVYLNLKDKGLYHYLIKSHGLKRVGPDACNEMVSAALNQAFICEPYLTFVICADFDRTCTRYGDRGERYVYMEVGHCGQNIQLMAVALGLDSVPIGAFRDSELKSLLELPRDLEPLYVIPVGHAK